VVSSRRRLPGRGAGLGERAALAGAALALDLVLGDRPLGAHPVAGYGRLMGWLERRLWRDSRRWGAGYALAGLLLAAGVGAAVRSRPAAALAALYSVLAARGLWDAAAVVERHLLGGDLAAARAALPALVGRDTSSLDEGEVARAVVESVAENTVDGFVAPLFWALVAGPAGALAVRGANTLDSMVGHLDARHRRFGWASARFDDAAAFVPARLAAAAVVVGRPWRGRAVLAAIRRDAPAHPSPNAGVAEAAFAAALGLRLGGTNRYPSGVERRPFLGDGRRPEVRDIGRAVRLSQQVAALALGACALLAACGRRGRGRA